VPPDFNRHSTSHLDERNFIGTRIECCSNASNQSSNTIYKLIEVGYNNIALDLRNHISFSLDLCSVGRFSIKALSSGRDVCRTPNSSCHCGSFRRKGSSLIIRKYPVSMVINIFINSHPNVFY